MNYALILQAILQTMDLLGRLGVVRRMEQEELKDYIEAREAVRKELVALVNELGPQIEVNDDVDATDTVPESDDGEADDAGSVESV